MKRSRSVQLALMGAVPLLVTACGEQDANSNERLLYRDVQQCIAEGRVSAEVCDQEYQRALQARAQQAPHFTNMNDCAAQYGDQCRPYVTSSGDHWFMPALTGFMIGQMLGHRRYDYYGAPSGGGTWGGGRPVYNDRADRSTWNGQPDWRNPGMHTPTTAETLSRGGFGSSGAARSSWGG
jgi:uncharacterized protein YgiB involved in biofilm formation